MSQQKSNAPLIIIVVLAILAIPCLLGVVVVAGGLFWQVKSRAPAPVMMEPARAMDSAPRAEAKAETSEPAMP